MRSEDSFEYSWCILSQQKYTRLPSNLKPVLQVSACDQYESNEYDWISGESRCEIPQCWIQGQCLGQTLDMEIVENEDACLAKCKSKSSCHWFTFFKPASECLLFRTCPAIDDTSTDFVSGESDCAARYTSGNCDRTSP